MLGRKWWRLGERRLIRIGRRLARGVVEGEVGAAAEAVEVVIGAGIEVVIGAGIIELKCVLD